VNAILSTAWVPRAKGIVFGFGDIYDGSRLAENWRKAIHLWYNRRVK